METSGTRPRPLSERERNELLQLHQWLNSPGVTLRSWEPEGPRLKVDQVLQRWKKTPQSTRALKLKQVDIFDIFDILYVTIREISHKYGFDKIDNMIFGYVWASLVGVFPAIWRLITVTTKTCTSTSSLVVHTADG